MSHTPSPPEESRSLILRLLPLPDSLEIRLAMYLLGALLVGATLLLLSFLEIMGIAPVDTEQTLVWVVSTAALTLLVLTLTLWRTLRREVLRPLELIRAEAAGENENASGLFEVAATMRELRDTVYRTQAKLDRSYETLRHTEKLAIVGRLAAELAHSVRNPLTSVKLRLFSLERSLSLAPRQQEDFSVIADAMRHVDGIVSNFLEFSRRPRLTLENVSPSEVLDACLRLLENRLAVFPVTISTTGPPHLPEVHADPDQLREALLNILLNACEAMDYAGTLNIEVGLTKNRRNAEFVFMRVEDSGPGIPPEVLAEIFSPFFSTKEQGTGLGLSIAKGILEEHGGDITAAQSPEGGAVFTLFLPVAGEEGKA